MNSARLRFLTVAFAALAASGASAATLGADFAADYTVVDLGGIAGLPLSYGGLTLKAGTTDTLLIGGGANGPTGRIYEVGLVRDADGHITGFSGTPLAFGDVGEYNDGGVTYGPGGVLFTAQWPVNNLGQTAPGSTDEDRVDSLDAFGVANSLSAIGFVPLGFAGAGQMKAVSFGGGQWYDIAIAPDGTGTFDILSATQIDLDPLAPGIQSLTGGPEGFVWIAGANAGFGVDSLLVSDYASSRISAYEIDANGDPIASTRRDFLTGLSGAEGAFVDPVTGDFLFSTFGGGNQIVRVSGFAAPDPGPDPDPNAVPLPASALLLLTGLAGAFGMRRRGA